MPNERNLGHSQKDPNRPAAPGHMRPNLGFSKQPHTPLLLGIAALLSLAAHSVTFAGSATWNSSGSTDWNTNTNWMPTSGYPGSTASDTATFNNLSSITSVFISAIPANSLAAIDFTASETHSFTVTVDAEVQLTLSGSGITNNSGITQNFVNPSNGSSSVGGSTVFTNSATAGSMTSFTNNGGTITGSGGFMEFLNTSTAGSATVTNNGGVATSASEGSTTFVNSANAGSAMFTNNGGTVSSGLGGQTAFTDTSTALNATITNNASTVSGGLSGQTVFIQSATAGSATITNNGALFSGIVGGLTRFDSPTDAMHFPTAGTSTITNKGATVSGAGGGETDFVNISTAGSATITNDAGTVAGAGGGVTEFTSSGTGNPTAGSATLIANGGIGRGGSILFFGSSTGGTARVEVFGNGNLDISVHFAPGVSIGSIEGSGDVFLGARTLIVGTNNASTTFSGVIQDGGLGGGTGGLLTKTGNGTLSLTNANTYSGGTLINVGTLIAAHDGALGSGNISLTASGVTLTLQSGVNNNYIADTATINITNGAVVNLNFTGASDVVSGIVLGGITETTSGTYGSFSSGATFESNFFTGTGTLFLVPEPSTWMLISFGATLLGTMVLRRRRRGDHQ